MNKSRNRLQNKRLFSQNQFGIRSLKCVKCASLTKREKGNIFLVTLPSLALCFQPHSRPSASLFGRLLEYAKIRTVLQSSEAIHDIAFSNEQF